MHEKLFGTVERLSHNTQILSVARCRYRATVYTNKRFSFSNFLMHKIDFQERSSTRKVRHTSFFVARRPIYTWFR